MQERRIDPPEGLEIWRLFASAFPLFIVPIVTLFAVFRTNKDLLNFRHPAARNRSLCLLRNGVAMIQADDAHNEHEEEACGDSRCMPDES